MWKKIAVLGAGPIGILLAQSAKALGAAQVLITDISTLRLALAKMCGVDFAVNTKEHDFGEALAECFGPDKANVIYGCTGNDTTMGRLSVTRAKEARLSLWRCMQVWQM